MTLLSRLIFIPTVFILSRLPGTIRLILTNIDETTDAHWLQGIQAFFDPAQGWMNAILFIGFVSPVRKTLKRSLNFHCPLLSFVLTLMCAFIGYFCCCGYCFYDCCKLCRPCCIVCSSVGCGVGCCGCVYVISHFWTVTSDIDRITCISFGDT